MDPGSVLSTSVLINSAQCKIVFLPPLIPSGSIDNLLSFTDINEQNFTVILLCMSSPYSRDSVCICFLLI